MRWYSWGSGASGLLAHGDTEDSAVPTPITAPPFADATTITSLCCSGVYSLACDSDCQLWHCGDTGQSCVASADDRGSRLLQLPVRISFAKSVVSVACGWSHCACISSDGELYTWGDNRQRQLGLPACHRMATVSFCPTPSLVSLASTVHSVSCGWRHTVALTTAHQLLGWGDNRAGQLSATTTSVPQPIPLPVAILPLTSHITSVHCGWRFTLLVASCGRVYCCGDNRHGQCGAGGGAKQLNQWAEVEHVRAVHAAVGWTHSLLLDALGRVWTFGRRSMGQAGTGRAKAMHGPQAVPEQVPLPSGVRIERVACGSESCLCVDSDGALWSWGWNEHGNVGRAEQPDEAQKAGVVVEQVVWEPRRVRISRGADTRVVAVAAGGASVFAAVVEAPCVAPNTHADW